MNNTSVTLTTCFFLDTTSEPSEHFDSLSLACLVLHSVSFLPAALGNGIVALTTLKTPSLHKPSFVLLSCAAMADSLTGFLAQPVAMASFAAKLRRKLITACQLDVVKEIMGWLFSGVSVSILALLSVERYLVLHLGTRYRSVVTVKRVLLAVTVFWLSLVILEILRFLVLNNKTFTAIHVPFMFLSLMTLTATYFQIHHYIKRQSLKLTPANNRQVHSFDIAKYKKITVAVLYIVCFYWLFFAPFVCVLVAYLILGFSEAVEGAYYITTTVILANAAVNPFLYCWKLRALRKAVLINLKLILQLD